MRTTKLIPVKTSKGWQLSIPPALSETGIRQRQYFKSRDDAEKVAKPLREKVRAGTVARVLPAEQASAAARAFEVLGDRPPEQIVSAVEAWIKTTDRRAASVPFAEAFTAFAEADTARRSPSYIQSLRQFRARLAPLHATPLCDVTPQQIEKAMRGFPASVFNYGLRILGGVFHFGQKRDWCEGNPIEKLDRKNRPPMEVEIYSPEQAAVLMANAAPELVPFLAVSFFAGLRASEARLLKWADVDLEENFIRIRASVSKTRRPRAIPIEKNLAQWLAPHIGQDSELIAPQGVNVLRKQLRAAHNPEQAEGEKDEDYKKRCVPTIKHGTRHSFASYLLARDGDIDQLVLALGHDDPSTTFRHYARTASKRDSVLFWSIEPDIAANVRPFVAQAG